MTTRSHLPLTFHADPEHGRLRLAVLLFLALSSWLSFLLLRFLLSSFAPSLASPVMLSCVGAVPLALAASAGVEAWLKRRWRSGTRVVLTDEEVRLERGAEAATVLRRADGLNRLWWQMPLSGYRRGGRERRISEKWLVGGGQLQQEQRRIVLFCFVEPERAEAWRRRFEMALLEPGDVYDSSLLSMEGPQRPQLPSEVITSAQGRYWLAERNRWQEGVELVADDFELLMEHLAPPSVD